ncbi:MAG: beta-galactosidase [Jatrophihabitans sp.]|uniref:beta-galactosidase n=1 Tax=Jatrophihabitans sp. TaxID=1932789 RepID=UPI003F7F623F
MSPRLDEVTARLGGIAYGGDYNPEQWPEEIWAEDIALMREAGVNLVTVGVFSWGLLQPAPGRFEFGWLDRVLDRLHEGGIAVDLATATASPPPWFTTRHPEAALVDVTGARRSHGARQAYCPSSAAFREATVDMAGAMVERYADHPAVVLWHVSNEYANHNWHCYCDASAEAFRHWLEARYGTIDALNAAWGTAFWSQHYGDWREVLPPRAVSYHSFANPTQQLDWWRFSSGEHVRLYRAEHEVIAARATQPVTTNFMSFWKPLDYWDFADAVDLVSNDDYLIVDDRDPAERTAMAADLMRSLASGEPWLLMEHSTSAVNWQPRNRAKAPGELRRTSLQHLARGADGALFFQWRASRAGAEKFHSALVPHAGTDSRVWHEVVDFGADLRKLGAVTGSRVDRPRVAIVHGWESWWAGELDSHPSQDFSPFAQLRRWYGALWGRSVGVDFARPGASLDGYDLVVVPGQYLVDDAAARVITEFVAGGGTVVITWFSGIVDEHDHVRLGGYPGAFAELLGVRIEEFAPLLAGQSVGLSDGSTATLWSEHGRTTTATAVLTYADGPTAGSPALTVHGHGSGHAWYVGTELSDERFGRLVDDLLTAAGVEPVVAGLPRGVEAVRRVGGDGAWLFLVNHTGDEVSVAADGTEVFTGRQVDGALALPAGGAAVVHSTR